MVAGYVRLSRDDDKKNYVSIENQKLIIRQYAEEMNITVERWYEDNGVSGYLFDRPGFNRMLEDLDKDIDMVFVKDFSRLGRHNAKVLLLLDAFLEKGKQLIVVDDHYDSMRPEDETIGIKTWINERYVKDTSKKIRRAIGARQKEGTLFVQPPFGYCRNEKDKSKIEIVEKEAETIRLIYGSYIKGLGYRKIANSLNTQGISTPSMLRREKEFDKGKISKRSTAAVWSDSMVKEILNNDFYIGTLRLHKRARTAIHGKDKRVPKEEQCIFENNHPAIIDRMAFALVQDMKEKRVKNNYRGSRSQWSGSEIPNPFGSCLFCKDCKKRLTPILRNSSKGERKYYICTTYNTKGKKFCEKAHLIENKDLLEDILHYIKVCRNSLGEVISSYNVKDMDVKQRSAEEKKNDLRKLIEDRKKELKVLLVQKTRDLANAGEKEDIINESYDAVWKDILSQIRVFQGQLTELQDTGLAAKKEKEKQQNALQVIDNMIEKEILDRRDIEILIERIEVDENGLPEIELKYSLSGLDKRFF